jgi:hypothetical protein
LVVIALDTHLLHAVHHISCSHTFGVMILDECDGVFCILFLLTKPLPIHKAKLLHVA